MRVVVRLPQGRAGARAAGHSPLRRGAPVLLVPWSSPRDEFLANLHALLDPRKPASRYWRDIFPVLFLPPWRPRHSLAASLLTHAAVVLLVWNLTPYGHFFWPSRARNQENRNPLRITWYHFANELPAISSGKGGGAKPSERGGRRRGPSPRGASAPGSQQIVISNPPQPDNDRQTIFQPDTPNIRITRDVRLPNIVMWHNVEKPMPPAAVAAKGASLDVPVDLVKREVAKLMLPASLMVKNVDLPQEVPNLERRISDLKIAANPSAIANPKLPVPPATPVAGNAPPNSEASLSPPAPAEMVAANGAGSNQLRRLIAIGVNPAPPGGPLEVPPGNREGSFSIGPAGKTPGTPHGSLAGLEGAGAVGPAPAGEGSGEGPGAGAGSGSGARDLAAIRVPGLSVSGGTGAPVSGPVVTGPPPPPPAPRPAIPSPLKSAERAALLARAARPQLPEMSRGEKQAELGFLPGKKIYTVYINMPNLSSAAGSWILRFAELADRSPNDELEITAPVALRKVDPGYEPGAIRDKVQGLVVLRAIIRKDGHVERIEILRSLDPRLDERAVHAMGRWEFQPGTRQGVPVDLEAVVQIPFALPRLF